MSEKQLQEAKIEVNVADEQNVDDTIITAGRVTFDDALVSHIYSPVNGRVIRIDAALGQRMKKGDSLAVIDSPDLGIASSDVGKAQADLLAAEHEYDRQKELYAGHAASQRDYESAEDSFRKAKAELDRALQKARLFRTGSTALVTQGFALTAPIEGEVIARTVSPGIEVQGLYGGGNAVELFTVGELDRVWIVADVYEQDLARVKVGSKVHVKVVAYPDKLFEGQVDWVAGTLDPQTRTVKVRCTFQNLDRLLKPEMYATVSISVDEKKALALPRTAVVRMGDSTVIFVEKGKTPDGRFVFERHPVTVDEGEGGQWMPITHGLEKGTRVATTGTVLLSQSVSQGP